MAGPRDRDRNRHDSESRAFDTISVRISLEDWYTRRRREHRELRVRGYGPACNFDLEHQWRWHRGCRHAQRDDRHRLDHGQRRRRRDLRGMRPRTSSPGNGGADMISGGAGNDVLYGGDADGRARRRRRGGHADWCGSGTDIASYASTTATTGMRAFLNAPPAPTRWMALRDTYNSIEGIEGTNGADKAGWG